MNILVTGAAGFIGKNLVGELKKSHNRIYTLDKLDAVGIDFVVDITNEYDLLEVFKKVNFDKVVHLAGKAGVRESKSNPNSYIHNNIIGFTNVLECCIKTNVKQVIYASSSSVYGEEYGLSEEDKCDKQLSIYAVTKKCNENLAYTYSHNYGIKTTGLRFFSVFGLGMRQDLMIYKILDSLMNNKPITVYGDGTQERDFTYIHTILQTIHKLVEDEQENNYEVYNLGNEKPMSLKYVIDYISASLHKVPNIIYVNSDSQDCKKTCSDNTKIKEKYGDIIQWDFEEGINKYIHQFKDSYL